MCQFIGQARAFRRQIKPPLPPILAAGALNDEALVDKLLQNARQRLLGDLQNIQQFRDFQAGIAMNEMQHPMMRPPEAVLFQHRVGVAGEIAVGEVEQFHAGNDLGVDALRPAVRRGAG